MYTLHYLGGVNGIILRFVPPGYVGVATVGASAWWFMYYDSGPQLSYWQLVSRVH